MRAIGAWLILATVMLGSPCDANSAFQDTPELDPLAPLPEEKPIPTGPARTVMQWVLASKDNGSLPYMIIDKTAAEVFVFNADGEALGETPVLIGSAKGDESAPGIGERELRAIPPEERTTPAGRFVANFGPAAGHEKVIWVDWSTAVSLHPVVTANRKERRLERLASPTPEDNRITYGCINVPASFYKDVVAPLLADTSAVVYILPDDRSLAEVFGLPGESEQPVSSN